MSVKGCEVSAVSWNFPRRHTNNTNCRSAVGAHRFIWHHRLQGQLEVINLQEGDSCVCVCVCVCETSGWNALLPHTPTTHTLHRVLLPSVLGLRLKFLLQLKEWMRRRQGEGEGRGTCCTCVCVCVMVTTCENAAARCLFTITWTVR